MKKRYVNIYKDEEGRFISDVDHDSRIECEESGFDTEFKIETVRILSKEEETELENYNKQMQCGGKRDDR
jgi:hypothetical protein